MSGEISDEKDTYYRCPKCGFLAYYLIHLANHIDEEQGGPNDTAHGEPPR